MGEVFVVAAFCLESHKAAWEFFHPSNGRDLETITGSRINLFIPELGDLFKPGGMRRFPSLQRSMLPCLWAEVSLHQPGKPETYAYFTIPLRGLSGEEIRDAIIDLADAAEGASDFFEWKNGFETRQKHRREPEVPADPVPPPPPRADAPAAVPAPANPVNAGPAPVGGDHADNHADNPAHNPANNPASNPNGGQPHKDHLLVTLGQKFGLPGVILGAFFLLFERLLGPKILPKVDPRVIIVIALLIFGISALALVIDLASRTTRRYIPGLALFFAALMVWWSTKLWNTAPESGIYNVRVIVMGTNGTPVSDAHVWCSLGGETKKIDGGWEIAIPRDPSAKKQEGKIWAEAAAQGLRGESVLTLGEGPVRPITLELKRAGELFVRGTVYDPNGYAAGNAIVSVEGYGEEAKPTEVNGAFALPTHAEQGQPITLHAEKPPYPPAELKDYKVGSGTATLRFKAPGARSDRAPPVVAATPEPAKTGDDTIDRVVANLAALKRLPRPATESQVGDALAPLFTRQAFYDIRQEDWRYFLYPLSISRKLLEEHVGDFKSHPDLRQKIGDAIRKMVVLESEVAGLFGPTFSLAEYLDKHGKTKKDFIDNLPALTQNPPAAFFEKAIQEVHAIREDLKAAGLPVN